MRRVSGADINGWRDIAARDWNVEEPDVRLEAARIVDGGLGTVAVKQSSGDWIGGPQALLAPHGRGLGWGELGTSERRVSLAPLLDDLRSGNSRAVDEIYGATVNALARFADDVILCVPDVQEFDEAAQFRTLSIFRRDRRQIRLLWKPVAVFLHALDCHAIPPNADGAVFRFLIHSGEGIELQTLRLRRDSEHPDHVAPERDGYGLKILRNLGLKQLADRAHASVVEANPLLNEGFCEKSTLGLRLICGNSKAGDVEILRLNNGNWIDIVAPEIAEGELFPNTDFKDLDFGTSETISSTFLLTPLAPAFASVLSSRLQAFFPNVALLDWEAAARGCLCAGRLIEKGLPHYFDRLTPISLAVMKRDEPQFDDLIGSNATLPANREYVSPPYRNLKWIAGKRDIEFYVLKGDDEVRFWSVHLNEAPKTDVAVELRIRQTPGQSWAKLSLTSLEWEPLQRAPIFLDWTALDPINALPKEILEKLRTPPPTIPIRIVESPSMEFWTGSDRLKGLNSVLAQMHRAADYDPTVLAPLLSRTQRDPTTHVLVRPVGTDGTLPNELSEQTKGHLVTALERCTKQIFDVSRRPLSDNGPIRCLTWTFTLCPEDIQDMVVEALEADLNRGGHPLLRPRSARKVLIQGAGRAVTGVSRLRRVLHSLVSRPANADTMNALSMILARREEAPRALTAALVEKIVGLASNELVHLTEKLSFQTRFRNALSATAALFRYREVEPFALLAGRDAPAQELRDNLEKAQAILLHYRNRVPRFDEKLDLVSSIRDFLDGSGDPAILVRIEDLGDDDVNEES
ncbi:hypothetical protein [Bradyrhizobium sp. JYMT SZCCT0180]|uniref:hypothetical protein n=1 Tax=Bradyrhizobium sp. JYMT SZCCT0180 TaxID=2807666 RepID=UPI001BA8706A|nr:hypothetical protein [Bradyrhizobium sp. JYMT SZCCT0180]MBR1214610.1 hypothetical protein [Bradyrhizobium sp. JYMT SZCCT0180]